MNPKYTSTEITILKKATLRSFKFIERKKLYKTEYEFLTNLIDNFLYPFVDEYSGDCELMRHLQHFDDELVDEYDTCYQSPYKLEGYGGFKNTLEKLKAWYEKYPKSYNEMWEDVQSKEYKTKFHEKRY